MAVKSWSGKNTYNWWTGITFGADGNYSTLILAKRGIITRRIFAVGNSSYLITLKLNDKGLTRQFRRD